MVVTGKYKGRIIYYDDKTLDWKYEDTNEICYCKDTTDYGYREDEKCPFCRQHPTKEGYDACLGHIQGANASCCGHNKEPGYISMKDGRRFILIDHKKIKCNEEYHEICKKYYGD